MKLRNLILIILCTSFSCIKKNPIEVRWSEDTSWSPTLIVVAQKYDMVLLEWAAPPENIKLGIREYHVKRYSMHNSYGITTILHRKHQKYLSPLLETGEEYSFLVEVVYINDIKTESEPVIITVESEPAGKIKCISSDQYMIDICYTKNELWGQTGDNEITKIDTCNGDQSLSFTFEHHFILDLTSDGFNLWVASDKLYQLNTIDNSITDSIDVDLLYEKYENEFGYGYRFFINNIVLNQNEIIVLFIVYASENTQYKILNFNRNDLTIKSSFDIEADYITGLLWDGQYIWYCDNHYTTDLNSSLIKIDIETLQVLEAIESPVANPGEITWDGEYCWIVDFFRNEICKIVLN
ncbi:hypothetical protein JW935_19285 [candidate division KSB1 bacterium]|nr:hypothetical protein [candidate division KSB1 bacterium]